MSLQSSCHYFNRQSAAHHRNIMNDDDIFKNTPIRALVNYFKIFLLQVRVVTGRQISWWADRNDLLNRSHHVKLSATSCSSTQFHGCNAIQLKRFYALLNEQPPSRLYSPFSHFHSSWLICGEVGRLKHRPVGHIPTLTANNMQIFLLTLFEFIFIYKRISLLKRHDVTYCLLVVVDWLASFNWVSHFSIDCHQSMPLRIDCIVWFAYLCRQLVTLWRRKHIATCRKVVTGRNVYRPGNCSKNFSINKLMQIWTTFLNALLAND